MILKKLPPVKEARNFNKGTGTEIKKTLDTGSDARARFSGSGSFKYFIGGWLPPLP